MTIATLLIAFITTVPTSPGGSGEPVMLDFTATWCGPCRQMRPVVEQLVQRGYPIKAIDIDESPDLAERYKISGVPCFVVIDPSSGCELGRTEGARPATELANLYNQARAPFQPAPRARPETETDPEAEADDTPAEAAREAAPARSPNPKPWETVVRIKVHGNGLTGYGSGTLIHSDPQVSLILTCAHLFKLEHGPTPPPSRFPRKITVDLFDGNLSGPQRNQVHYSNETFVAEAIDYDFARDVALIRIRPGRRLPHARVVPAHWKPRANFAMIALGCPEGHDATAWDTVIVNPAMKGLNGNRTYEAIECMVAPKQGRSGGGLFTTDGYLAGVCDFAEPQGNHGLYAAPSSIYTILDRNDLMALYAPVRSKSQTLLAKNQRSAPRSSAPEYRLQSPDRNDPGNVTLPPPSMLGIKEPVLAENNDVAPTTTRQRSTAHLFVLGPGTAELKMDPSVDPDRFGPSETIEQPELPPASSLRSVRRPASTGWRAARETLPEITAAGVR